MIHMLHAFESPLIAAITCHIELTHGSCPVHWTWTWRLPVAAVIITVDLPLRLTVSSNIRYVRFYTLVMCSRSTNKHQLSPVPPLSPKCAKTAVQADIVSPKVAMNLKSPIPMNKVPSQLITSVEQRRAIWRCRTFIPLGSCKNITAPHMMTSALIWMMSTTVASMACPVYLLDNACRTSGSVTR